MAPNPVVPIAWDKSWVLRTCAAHAIMSSPPRLFPWQLSGSVRMGSLPAITQTAVEHGPRPASTTLPRGTAVGLIILLTCIVYLPALSGGFILDDDLLLHNALVKAPD